MLLAAFASVLGAWSPSRRFSVVLTLFNTLPFHPDVTRIVGDFTSTTLLVPELVPGETFEVRARRLQERLWSDLDHRWVSGVEVAREVARRRGRRARAATPVVFTSTLDLPEGAVEAPELAGEVVYSLSQTPQVLLDHQVREGPEGLNAGDGRRHAHGLPGAARAPRRHRRRVAGAGPRPGSRRPARAANATAAAMPGGLLHSRFLERAERHPELPAVLCGEHTLTYGELTRRARRLGRRLRRHGARPGRLVAVVMEKGSEQVVAVIAVLEAGAAYLPVDPEWPEERRFHLLARCGVELALTQPRLKAGLAWPGGVKPISVDGGDSGPCEEPRLEPVQQPGDLAYVIFTSGSTGLPKGVMIEHRAALNTLADVNERFAVAPGDRVLALSALSFDLSVFDVFGPLSVGGALVLPPPAAVREPAAWLDLVRRHGVTLWNTVPALMELLVETAETSQERSILYGQPMANQSFQVLDKAFEPCPEWVPGELYIGGAGVARGYWGDARRTSDSFVTAPGGERLYATGDLGRYLPGGVIELLGRRDFQVKLRGYRIELGEIEAALLRHPAVRAAAATVAGAAPRDRYLAAYVVLETTGGEALAELMPFLREKLPAYIVPAVFVPLEALPLTANGKVDRGSLPDPGAARPREREGGAAPRNAVEQRLAALFAGVLEVDSVGVHDDFFALGGSSVGAILLISRIREALAVDLPLGVLLESPTVAAVAETLAASRKRPERSPLVAVTASGTRPPFFCVHPAGGSVACYTPLARLLGPDQPFYGLQSPGLDGECEPLERLDDMAARYLEEIRGAQGTGPYLLGGWSFGGLVAFEIARRLEDSGKEVALLALLDATPNQGEEVAAEKAFEIEASIVTRLLGRSIPRFPRSSAPSATRPTSTAWLPGRTSPACCRLTSTPPAPAVCCGSSTPTFGPSSATGRGPTAAGLPCSGPRRARWTAPIPPPAGRPTPPAASRSNWFPEPTGLCSRAPTSRVSLRACADHWTKH